MWRLEYGHTIERGLGERLDDASNANRRGASEVNIDERCRDAITEKIAITEKTANIDEIEGIIEPTDAVVTRRLGYGPSARSPRSSSDLRGSTFIAITSRAGIALS